MLDIAKEYMERLGKYDAIRTFVNDLMRGDPASFKAGYSKENAIIATAEAFDMTTQAVRQMLPTAADRLRDHREFYGPPRRDC